MDAAISQAIFPSAIDFCRCPRVYYANAKLQESRFGSRVEQHTRYAARYFSQAKHFPHILSI